MTVLINQVLSFVEISFKQLIEVTQHGLIPSGVTSKILESISMINVTNLIGEKEKRFPREFPELFTCIIILLNQVLTCGEIGFNQSCEAYITCFIPSEVTGKIVGSISVVNVIDLLGEKKNKRFPREFPGNVVNGICLIFFTDLRKSMLCSKLH